MKNRKMEDFEVLSFPLGVFAYLQGQFTVHANEAQESYN